MFAVADEPADQGSDIKRIRTCCRGCGKMERGRCASNNAHGGAHFEIAFPKLVV